MPLLASPVGRTLSQLGARALSPGAPAFSFSLPLSFLGTSSRPHPARSMPRLTQVCVNRGRMVERRRGAHRAGPLAQTRRPPFQQPMPRQALSHSPRPSPSSTQAYQGPNPNFVPPRRSPMNSRPGPGYGPTGRGVAVGAFSFFFVGCAASCGASWGEAGRNRLGGARPGAEPAEACRAQCLPCPRRATHAGARSRRTGARERVSPISQHAPPLSQPPSPLFPSPQAAPPCPPAPSSAATAPERSPCARSASTSGRRSCSSASCPLRAWCVEGVEGGRGEGAWERARARLERKRPNLAHSHILSHLTTQAREITNGVAPEPFRWTAEALLALQEVR